MTDQQKKKAGLFGPAFYYYGLPCRAADGLSGITAHHAREVRDGLAELVEDAFDRLCGGKIQRDGKETTMPFVIIAIWPAFSR